jgi:hypothetical protein
MSIVFRKPGLSLIIGLITFSCSVFAQAPQERIVQPIIVNGQQTQGVFVIQNGTIQRQTCPSPQQYLAADHSSSGWACFESSTGMWLLQAVPPAQSAVPQQAPTIIYSQPAPIYIPAPIYSYPYDYYSLGYPYYGYPYMFRPSFGFGFGFGFGFRSPTFVGRPFGGRPFIGRPPVGPFVASRPFAGGFTHGGMAFGRVGRR